MSERVDVETVRVLCEQITDLCEQHDHTIVFPALADQLSIWLVSLPPEHREPMLEGIVDLTRKFTASLAEHLEKGGHGPARRP